MFDFLKKLFRKDTEEPLPGSSPLELWKANLSSIKTARLENALEEVKDDNRFSLQLDNDSVIFDVHKENLFAWFDIGTYKYRNFSYEAEFDFGEPEEKCSAGIVFRKLDDSTFAYALVSSTGEARLDIVTNGEPHILVPWTSCPWLSDAQSIVMSVVAHSTHIIVLLNGRMALEAEEDTLLEGGIAFAIQTYSGFTKTRLLSMKIESRPMEVEVDYIQFINIGEIDLDQRRRITESLIAINNCVPALVHLKKIQNRNAMTARDYFLEAECQIHLEMLDEASVSIEKSLELDPNLKEAQEEKFNILYLSSRFTQLSALISEKKDLVLSSPRLCNLEGHTYFYFGQLQEAANSYERAFTLDPHMPIYAQNAATTYDKLEDYANSSQAWLKAAKTYYNEEAWDDAMLCTARLRELGFDKNILDSMEGMIFYANNNYQEALKILGRVYKKNKADSSAVYVYALLLAQNGNRAEATEAFKKASVMENDCALYSFRYAESMFISKQNGLSFDEKEFKEALEKAISLNPNDGWTVNLAGRYEMDIGNKAEAEVLFKKAIVLLPKNVEPVLNLSQLFMTDSKEEEALSVFENWQDNAQALNQCGNVYMFYGNTEKAIEVVTKAVETETDESLRADFRINLADILIKQNQFPDAEEQLRKALEVHDDVRGFALMGDIAMEYGELSRAEVSYRAAAEASPGDPAIMERLASYYIYRHKYQQASQIADDISHFAPDISCDIKKRIEEATTEKIKCASCSTVWTVPRQLPKIPRTVMYAMPPDLSPAGTCPECGKTFCVKCRKDFLEDSRFTCPDCHVSLKLNDDRVRYLVTKFIAEAPSDC